jgi:hypothetical protein
MATVGQIITYTANPNIGAGAGIQYTWNVLTAGFTQSGNICNATGTAQSPGGVFQFDIGYSNTSNPVNILWNGQGTYVVKATATDANGNCFTSYCVTENVTNVGCPTISISANHTCNGTTDANVTIAVGGGVAPYTYSIDSTTSYQSSNVFNNVSLSGHTFRVKDANGCDSNAIGYTPTCGTTCTLTSVTIS